MKVSELIKMLADMPVDAEVILQKDSEGNGFRKAWGVEAGVFENLGYGEVEFGYSELTFGLIKQGFTDDDLLIDGKPAVVIYPG